MVSDFHLGENRLQYNYLKYAALKHWCIILSIFKLHRFGLMITFVQVYINYRDII